MIVNDLENPFIASVVRAIEQAAEERSLSVLLGDARRDPDRERRYADLVRSQQADGVIQLSSRLPFDPAQPIPIVFALERSSDPRFPTVQIDNRDAARQTTDYLLGLGHKRIGVLAGPVQSTQSQDRMLGFRDAMTQARIPADENLIFAADYQATPVSADLKAMLSSPSRPTAFFCFNDLMALSLMRTAKDLALDVPRDLAVVGFDDMPLAALLTPRLTTVRQPKIDIGTLAVKTLLQSINGDEVPSISFVPFQLVVRESSGPSPP